MLSFAALADPTRRAIVALLVEGERTAGEIVERFDMSAPAISQHLKILLAARLISVRVDSQRRIYALDPEGLHEIEAWIAKMRRAWEKRLDALDRARRAEDARVRKKR